MSTWVQAIDAIETAPAGALTNTRPRRWHPFLKRLPVTVTGLPGAGKTELFRRLTARDKLDAESSVADTGYARTSKRRLAWAVRTIPGAASANRYRLTDRLFYDRGIRLYGLIHVVSFGYNTVWREGYTVESQLRSRSVIALRKYQLQKELKDFTDLVELIAQKTRRGRTQDLWPRWLLVVVNKVDLFWDQISAAGDYYLPGSMSPFDERRQDLSRHFGGLFTFTCETLPVTLSTSPFRFAGREMDLTVDSQLSADQVAVSVQFLARRLEALSGF